jgi:anti-sigma factor RsiW
MFRSWWLRRSIVCRQAVMLMSDYLDGQLSKRDRLRLEAHLGECPHCSEYLEQLRVTIASLGKAEPAMLSDDALHELVDLYRSWQADT